jgi:hypothetical protein
MTQSTNHRTRIFISYQRQDNQITEYHKKLRDLIKEDLGLTVWMDEAIGAAWDWNDEIDAELEQATHLVLIWSPRAALSQMVMYEVASAVVLSVPIIVVIPPEHRDFGLTGLPNKFNRLQYVFDPIALSEERTKFLRGIIDGATPISRIEPELAAPFAALCALRRKAPQEVQPLVDDLNKWALNHASEDDLKLIQWLLERIVSKDTPREAAKAIREFRYLLEGWIEDPKSRIDEHELREFLIGLRVKVITAAKRMRAAGAPSAVIQDQIADIVSLYCQPKFGTDKLPPVVKLGEAVKFTPGIKRECGLCKANDAEADHQGCCTRCGLFYIFWEPREIADFEEHHQDAKPK